jgi:hypothetical protein
MFNEAETCSPIQNTQLQNAVFVMFNPILAVTVIYLRQIPDCKITVEEL